MVRDLSVSTLASKKSRFLVTPPFTKLPKWERIFWPAFMFVGIIATPAWILYHLPDYRGGAKPHVSYIRAQQREAERAANAAQAE